MSEAIDDLAPLLDALRERIGMELRVALPARIESYDAGKQLCSCKPLVQDRTEDGEGNERLRSLPVVSNVPVCWPAGGGAFLSFPLQKGETVLLVFGDRSLDRWLSLGSEVDPVDVRTHHLSDAIAIPGLHAQNALLAASASDAVLQAPSSGLLQLGTASGGEPVIKGDSFKTALNTLLDAISTNLPAVAGAITTFKLAWGTYLSGKTRTG